MGAHQHGHPLAALEAGIASGSRDGTGLARRTGRGGTLARHWHGRSQSRRRRAVTFELRHVTKKVRGETHIDDVSLTFAHGTLNILLGPTLSGKTSLMRLMAGLDVPTEGSVVIDGKDVTGLPVRRRSVAMVYQQFINYPNLTVYENIASPLRVGGVARNEIDRRVRDTAAMLKL